MQYLSQVGWSGMSASDKGGCNPHAVYEQSLALGMDWNPKFGERKKK